MPAKRGRGPVKRRCWNPALASWLPPGGRLTPPGFHLASTWRPPGFHLASNLAHLGSNLVQNYRFGAILAPSGLARRRQQRGKPNGFPTFLLCVLFTFCAPCWNQLGAFWNILASSWLHLGATWRPKRSSWNHLGASWYVYICINMYICIYAHICIHM